MTTLARRVALVTHAGLPELAPDERALVLELARLGVHAEPVVWDDPAAAWETYDAVVIRSPWDYHLKAAAFHGWLDRLESAGVPAWNPPAVLRWNADKRYLRDLEARGIAVVPTRWVERGDDVWLARLLDETGWDAVVVKPAVSASAHLTWRSSRATAANDDARFRALAAAATVLVQPYLATIERDGELSFVFLDGEFSHAVRKRPRAGDFRVQVEHGGTADVIEPGPALVRQAEAVLAAARADTLYARVDGCAIDGRLVLMELELVEPALFLLERPGAAARLAAAIVRRMDAELASLGARAAG